MIPFCSFWLISDPSQLYRRLTNRPDNDDTPAVRQRKEKELGEAFLKYLAGKGKFERWREAKEIFESVHVCILPFFFLEPLTYQLQGQDPVAVWTAYATDEKLRELAHFAKMVFSIVVNTAGCERAFSHLKIIQTPHRARLGKDKLEAMTKVRDFNLYLLQAVLMLQAQISSKIRADNLERGVVKLRGGRKNHKNTDALMSVPRYRDLLEDQADEDWSERGRLLVNSAAGWRTEMAKWIADSRAAEVEEQQAAFNDFGSEDDDFPEQVTPGPSRLESSRGASSTTAKLTLKTLFSGLPAIKSIRLLLSEERPQHLEDEQELMQALAEEVADDGEASEEAGRDEQDDDDDVQMVE